jgi:LmbE family N-acetylglucosaminyl deacetylase
VKAVPSASVAIVAFVHAHPDDECIVTAGTMAALADAGHRVVLVLATRGELGEVPEGFLADGESLTERRVQETMSAAEILGVDRVVFLGYHDSGMAGEPTNDAASAFWQADLGEAARRLLAVLAEEGTDRLVTYDERGGYGHPDHVQVHRLGAAVAAAGAGVRVLEATMNRDHIRADREADGGGGGEDDGVEVGMPIERIHLGLDVRPWLDRKRAAMRAHRSQIAEESFFLSMPAERFELVFGTEWYIRHDEPGGDTGPIVAAGLDDFLDAFPAPVSVDR